MKKKHAYCKVCSRVRENCFYDYKKIENLIVTSDTEYLHLTSSDRVVLDVFVNSHSYFEYPDYELINGKCCQLEVFSYARDLFAGFSAVLVRLYLNYTIEYFSELTSQVSLSDEGKIIRKFLFESSLMCLMRLIQVNVMLMTKINQNLVHMARLYVTYKYLQISCSIREG